MSDHRILLILCASLICFFLLKNAHTMEQQKSFRKSTAGENPQKFSICNISNLSYRIDRDGLSGMAYYPRLTSNVLYAEGLGITGYVQDTVHVNWPKLRAIGGFYSMYTSPGWIEQSGNGQNLPVPVSPENPRARVYRIRRDFVILSPEMPEVIRDAAEMNYAGPSEVSPEMAQAVIDQYHLDWQEWPTDLGAPVIDLNGNGQWDQEEGMADADQIIWFVFNDADITKTYELAGCPPLGLEIQVTLWGYNHPNARLGQMMFKKYRIINKSGFKIDSMYFEILADPDIGYWLDDLAGCDSTAGLGYVYNGSPTDLLYNGYGLPPPAFGYDILQGPLIHTGMNSDTAIYNFGYKTGYKNLPCTSITYWAAGDPTIPDLIDFLQGSYNATYQLYNLLRGFLMTTDIENPVCYTHRAGPNNGKCTKFPLNGDPVAGTGDVDGSGGNMASGDRQIFLSSGPFNMAAGDTQEVVIALVAGISNNNISAVAELKENDGVAQELYNNLFSGIPKAPPAPQVQVFCEEDKIILNWGFDQTAVDATEKTELAGYQFEGYNLYQLPSQFSTKSEAVRIATFDVINGVTTIYGERYDPSYNQVITVPVQYGEDKGVQRYFRIAKNYLTEKPLYAGNTYYFAVTAYNYNENPELIEDKALESTLSAIPVIPQPPPPGTRYESQFNSSVSIEHHTGNSDGQVAIKVIDPARVTGNTYQIFFTENTDTTLASEGEILWNLRNETTGDTIVRGKLQASQLAQADEIIADGLAIKVAGPPPDFKEFLVVANGAGAIDPPEIGCFAFNANGFPFLFNDLYPNGTDRPDGDRQQTNGSAWGLHTGETADNDGGYAYFITRVTQGEARWSVIIPYDFEIRFTAGPNWGLEPGAFTGGDNVLIEVPFELWNIGVATPEDPSDDYRLFPHLIDDNADGIFNFTGLDHPVSGGDNDPETDWFYWVNPLDKTSGSAGYDEILAKIQANVVAFEYLDPTVMDGDVIRRMVFVNWNGGSVSDPTFPANVNALTPEEGTIFRIVTTKPNSTADIFRFVAPQVITDQEIAKVDVEKINVFPNPYYAFHSEETNRMERFITFNHLPEKATIRIFNLTGTQVRKLEKEPGDGRGQFFRWDLNNETGLPVASGLYIAYIDMPDLGKSKVVKFYIIQRRQILSTY